MSPRLLICSDLDRTLLPNGHHPESPGAREAMKRLVSRDEIDLAYVSGRDLALVLSAMESYRLPDPRWIIGDVGTSIHESAPGGWRLSESWQALILRDWGKNRPARLMDALDGIGGMAPQEPARQGAAKISYYTAVDADRSGIESTIAKRLGQLEVSYRLVWSADEILNRGLLDILPVSASKLHAIEFLIAERQHTRDRTLFAGDSGNDLEVLASDLPSVLVANAHEDLRALAVELAARQGHGDALYLARGGFLGMNGNYSAGILEGVGHYFPETIRWMQGSHGDARETMES